MTDLRISEATALGVALGTDELPISRTPGVLGGKITVDAVAARTIGIARTFSHPVEINEDFRNFLSSGTSPSFPGFWYTQASGAGAGGSIVNAGSRGTTENGILRMSTGTTAAGSFAIMGGYNQNWDPLQGPFSIGFKMRVPVAPTAGEDFEVQLALINDRANDASGIFFAYNRDQLTWMVCHTGPITKQVTAIVLPINTWTYVSVIGNQFATETYFWFDGVAVGPVDCSGAGGQYAVGARINKKAGLTARYLEIDTCIASLQNTLRAAWPNPV